MSPKHNVSMGCIAHKINPTDVAYRAVKLAVRSDKKEET